MALHSALAIETRQLTKKFGYEYALNQIDLHIERGRFVSILGPNGAGKTTLLRILATLTKPTSGQILIDGNDLNQNSVAARQQLGVLTHQVLLYGRLTAYENLQLFGALYGIPALDIRIEACLESMGLSHLAGEPVLTFSRGTQQRLAIARATLHDPQILLLDEPYTGLDQAAMQYLDDLLHALHARGKTILMTTHAIERLDHLNPDLVILAGGRVVLTESGEELHGTEYQSLYEKTLRTQG
jgi:heme exporter protein A